MRASPPPRTPVAREARGRTTRLVLVVLLLSAIAAVEAFGQSNPSIHAEAAGVPPGAVEPAGSVPVPVHGARPAASLVASQSP